MEISDNVGYMLLCQLGETGFKVLKLARKCLMSCERPMFFSLFERNRKLLVLFVFVDSEYSDTAAHRFCIIIMAFLKVMLSARCYD